MTKGKGGMTKEKTGIMEGKVQVIQVNCNRDKIKNYKYVNKKTKMPKNSICYKKVLFKLGINL